MKIFNSFLILLTVSFFLGGCSANKLLSSWNDNSIGDYSISTVLIVGVAAHDETKRRIYEDTFTDSLNAAGTKAVASYTLSKQTVEPSEIEKELRAVVKKAKAKTVLITHVVSAKEKDVYIPSTRIVGTNSYSNDYLYHYYSFIYNSVSAPGSYVSKTQVILESNLYDVQTEKLIWTARTESIDPVMTRKYYQQLIDLFLSDLSHSNLIK